jgi:histidyl-tRNA synthetase
MATTPRNPSGMRDFLPSDMLKRHYVVTLISEIFEAYGFESIYTPVLELKTTLTGQYGSEAEKLIYYAHHAGSVEDKEELALRYDLTVPLARFFAQHENDLKLPFKRYHIAPVWRGDRPQRGRFREFFQTDADIVGVATMDADAEVMAMMAAALQKLAFNDFVIKLNNRHLLRGIGEYAGLAGEALNNLYIVIDRADKIGIDGVRNDLLKQNISPEVVDRIIALISYRQEGSTGYAHGQEVLRALAQKLSHIPSAMQGIDELSKVLECLNAMHVPSEHIDLDFTVVRGLGYYTSTIFEAMLTSADPEERVGSVGGGGRYDNLIGRFRKNSLPTVGMSLGIERLLTIMEKRNSFPPNLKRATAFVYVTVFNQTMAAASMAVASEFRAAGIPTELAMQTATQSGYPKLGKQIAFADDRGIPMVAILGETELAEGTVKLKDLPTKEEKTLRRADAIQALHAAISSRLKS